MLSNYTITTDAQLNVLYSIYVYVSDDQKVIKIGQTVFFNYATYYLTINRNRKIQNGENRLTFDSNQTFSR